MTSILLLLFSFFSEKNIASQSPAAAGFTFRVEQKKADVPFQNHEITLKKKFFDLVFEFAEPAAVRIAVSFDSLSFVQARSGFPAQNIDAFKTWEGGGLAEPDKLGLQNMGMAKGAYNYWFYDDRKAHRFTRTLRTTGKITCWRSIGSIEIFDTQEKLDITDADRPLYFVITTNDGGQVEYLKIYWK